MSLMKFELGANVLQFENGASYPALRPIEIMGISDRTASGGLQYEELGIKIKTRVLNFELMSLEEYLDLADFFENVAEGAKNTFTFTDERGFPGDVTFVEQVLNFSEDDFELFSGSLTVEYK